MRNLTRRNAFTIAEMMIAMAGSAIIVGALLFSSIGLQRSFRASEIYAASQADQRRLIDYLGRDLRRAVAIALSASVNGGEGSRVGTEPVLIEKETGLRLMLPGYYKSNAPAEMGFDQALPVVLNDRRVDYGNEAGHAPSVPVIFRKLFLAGEGCVCFVRQEADHQEIIVRNAESLGTRITLSSDGTSCLVEVWFNSPMGSSRPLVAAHDRIMLRNNRID